MIRYNLKAVIFDMDGVITNTMQDHFFAWKSVLNKSGISVTHEDIYSREGQQGLQSVSEIYSMYNKPLTKLVANKLLKEKEALFKKIVKTRFIVGSRSFINRLHKDGFKLAIVTGTSRHEMVKMLPEKILNLFDVVVTGTDVKKGKPNPEPFKKAVKELNIKKEHVIVIENAPLGIESAKKAGLHCIAIETSLNRSYLKQADRVFRNFKELNSKIKIELI